MRATDGRPYELKSVPTKTVAIRTSGNCSDLVQKLCLHPCLPLEGKVPAQPADEVFSEAFLHCACISFASARPSVAEKALTNGMGKPIPYTVQTELLR